jgi:hypothetical protein
VNDTPQLCILYIKVYIIAPNDDNAKRFERMAGGTVPRLLERACHWSGQRRPGVA